MHMLPFGVQIKPSYVDSPNLFNAATYIEKGSLVGRTRASYINTYYLYCTASAFYRVPNDDVINNNNCSPVPT